MKRALYPGKCIGVISAFLLAVNCVPAQNIPQYYNTSAGTNNNSYPLNSLVNNKVQWLYNPNAFKTGGVTGTPAPAGMISSVYFRLGSTTSPVAVYDDFTIKLSQNVGTINQWTNPVFVTGMDTGFYATSYSLVNPLQNQWYQITLQHMVPYDPALSLVLEICVSSGTGNTILDPLITVSLNVSRWGPYSATSGTTGPRVIDFGFDITPGITDAGLAGFVNVNDTMCDGSRPVAVALTNYGQSLLTSADIEWAVNQTLMPTLHWTGSLGSSATTQVALGNYPFMTGTSYHIRANTKNPNGLADTININDTVFKPAIHIMPTPGINLNDTVIIICQGDTAMISGTLYGIPPWNLVVSDGINNTSFSNVTNPLFSLPVTPLSSKTYTFLTIADATICENTSEPKVMVAVQNEPPALITAMSPTSICEGDTVMLLASIGLGFTYQWHLDGLALPGETLYFHAAASGGDYTVMVINPFGCSALSDPTTVTTYPLPVMWLGNDTSIYPSQIILLDPGAGYASYLWSTPFNDTLATSQTLLVDSSGTGIGTKTVWVHVTDKHGCEGGDTILIHFTFTPGIGKDDPDISFRILPNPADDAVNLWINSFPPGYYEMEIVEVDGRRVYHSSFFVTLEEEQIPLDITSFSEGLYIVKIKGEELILSEKLIVK